MVDVRSNESPGEKAFNLLSKYLDENGIREFEEISVEMESIFATHPSPSLQTAENIIASFFRARGVDNDFLNKWFNGAKAHATGYGIGAEGLPIAMLADFGMFRFLEFLREKDVPDDVIFQIFSSAAQGDGEGKISLWGM
ncbi:MAG: hypothetical protein SFU91_02340 [Chloroherpetonaceae bacterium]|nr:hypothetical protein [Chloroherpetonaceae bacterium]